MFESLSEKLGNVFGKLRGRGSLSENDVMSVAREIRVALLEADVALPVVKDFIEGIKAKAVGQNVIKGINPGQQVVKIVHDALVELLGSQSADLTFGAAPCVYLMAGLQGSGKTTSTAKIARMLTDRYRKKVLMASLDIHRPAAQEQLRQLGEQTGVATLPVIAGQKPVEIALRAIDTGRKEGYDVVILDTAGRLAVDEALMEEVKAVQKASNPVETLFVADAMTGQDAVNIAKAFDERLNLTGIILTRMDGDARGGAALSMKAITGKPIKLIGTGEKWDALESFHPDRVAGRILGMGDIVSLVERAAETVDRAEAEKMAKKFGKGNFDFDDLLAQIRQMNRMGGMGVMMKMLPGLSGMAGQLEKSGIDENVMKRQEAIILSMTKKERERPELLNASRKKRVAAGAGATVQDINQLYKQLQQMQTVMKRMRKMGAGKMMGMMKQMMGGKADDLALMAQSMDPDGLAQDMAGLDLGDSPIGPNPFANMGSGMGSMPGNLSGLLGHGGSAKNRKKKRR